MPIELTGGHSSGGPLHVWRSLPPIQLDSRSRRWLAKSFYAAQKTSFLIESMRLRWAVHYL